MADDGDFWAEGGNVPLPNSGYYAHYANARHCYAPGARSWKGCFATFEPVSLTPHRVIDWTFDAYLRGEDPVMTAALRE